MHVHATCPEGEVKYWLEPEIGLAKNYGLSQTQLKEIENIIKEHYGEFKDAWKKHFKS